MLLPFITVSQYISAVSSEVRQNLSIKIGVKTRPRPPVDKEGNSLKGKTAIVTGANRGVGKEIVIGLLQRGCRVILACRDIALGKQAADEVTAKHRNGEAKVMKLDLGCFASVREFAREVNQKENRVDFLIHNAGLIYSSSTIVNPENVNGHEGLEMMMVVHYWSPVLLTCLLYNQIKRTPDSTILFVNSISSLFPHRIHLDNLHFKEGFTGTFAESKVAVMCFIKRLAPKAFSDNIRVYAVDPGICSTGFQSGFLFWKRMIVTSFSRLYKRSVEDAANSILCSILMNDPANNLFYCDGKARKLPLVLKDNSEVEAVWQKTKQLLQSDFDSLQYRSRVFFIPPRNKNINVK